MIIDKRRYCSFICIVLHANIHFLSYHCSPNDENMVITSACNWSNHLPKMIILSNVFISESHLFIVNTKADVRQTVYIASSCEVSVPTVHSGGKHHRFYQSSVCTLACYPRRHPCTPSNPAVIAGKILSYSSHIPTATFHPVININDTLHWPPTLEHGGMEASSEQMGFE